MEEKKSESKLQEVDLSNAFLTLPICDFLDEVRRFRKESALKISVDFSSIENQDEFVGLARRLKAFLETAQGQKRYATIRAKQGQVSWEPNVFSSGVKFERVD
jgi:hypothetical protein